MGRASADRAHPDTASFLEKKKKKEEARVQYELFQPLVFGLGHISSWWFQCLSSSFLAEQQASAGRAAAGLAACRAWLKIGRQRSGVGSAMIIAQT